MLIQEKPFKHWLENFYGYGSWHAPIWFVGYEEPGGDLPEDVADKINYFYNVHASPDGDTALCDIRNLYSHVSYHSEGPRAELFKTMYDYRFGQNAILNGVWKNLIAFRYGFQNQRLPDLLEYQKDSLATGKEALLNLLPLPSPHAHAWYYAWLDLPGVTFLKSRTQYEDHVYARRIRTILEKIISHKPDVVLMYGMENINRLKESVQEFFPNTKFKMVKGIKRQIPQHHRTQIDNTILVITTQMPALKHNRIETGFDWEALARTLKPDQPQETDE